MDKTCLQILESVYNDLYDFKGDDRINVEEVIKAMKIAMKQAYIAGVLAELGHSNGDMQTADEYINKLEKT